MTRAEELEWVEDLPPRDNLATSEWIETLETVSTSDREGWAKIFQARTPVHAGQKAYSLRRTARRRSIEIEIAARGSEVFARPLPGAGS